MEEAEAWVLKLRRTCKCVWLFSHPDELDPDWGVYQCIGCGAISIEPMER